MSGNESSIKRLITRLRVMVILVLSGDLVFCTGHNLVHNNYSRMDINSNQSLAVSILILFTLCYDISSIISVVNSSERRIYLLNFLGSKWNKEIAEQQKKIKLDLIDKKLGEIYKRDKEKESANTKVNDDSNFLHLQEVNDYDEEKKERRQQIQNLIKERSEEIEKLVLMKRAYKRKQEELTKEYQNCPELEFCIKGIKMQKLKFFSAKYYNSLLLMKYIFFELFFITMQHIPIAQAICLIFVQAVAFLFNFYCSFKKNIFKSRFLALMLLLLDVLVLMYYIVMGVQAGCEFSGIGCISKNIKQYVLFVLMFLITVLLFIYFIFILIKIIAEIRKLSSKKRTVQQDVTQIAGNPQIRVFFLLITDSREKEKKSEKTLV